MIQSPTKSGPQTWLVPIGHRFTDQKMEERVVSRRDGTPQARLLGILTLFVNELDSLIQKIIVKRHSLSPFWITAHRLFRFAAKTEIREQSPFFVGAYLIEKECFNAARHFRKLIFPTSRI